MVPPSRSSIPFNDATIERIGIALVYMGRYEEGLESVQRELALTPGHPLAHQHVAGALERNERIEEALPHYAISCKAYMRLGSCTSYGLGLAKLRRFGEALPLLRAECGKSDRLCADYAIALQLAGRAVEARAAAARAAVVPDNYRPDYSLACYHALLKW